MEYLQYIHDIKRKLLDDWCFKPYYKWNTFNTIATTKKGFKFPIYRVDFYTIVVPTNEGTICGYPADGYKFCSFVSRTDVIDKVEFVKSKEDILQEGLTYFGVFGDAMLKYNYSSFYHCVPVTPTMITL